jgi:hypothetical protein
MIPEGLAVLLFVASVIGVYLASFAMVWSRVLSRRDPGQRHGSARRILEPLTHGLAIFGLGCIGYGRWVEPFRLETTYLTMTSAKFAAAAEPIRVAQFSDLHSDEVERLEPILIERLRQLQPDLVTFTGDTSNRRSGDPVAMESLRAISGIAPTFAVKGNWDSSQRTFELFEKAGITELDGTSVTLRLKGSEVWLGGIAVGNERALDLAAMRPPRDLFSIVLYVSGRAAAFFPESIQVRRILGTTARTPDRLSRRVHAETASSSSAARCDGVGRDSETTRGQQQDPG